MVNSCSSSFLRTEQEEMAFNHTMKDSRLPIDGRKNFLTVTVLKPCKALPRQLQLYSWRPLKTGLNSCGYNVILAWRQRDEEELSRSLLFAWFNDCQPNLICWKLPQIVGLITKTQNKGGEFLTWILSANKRPIQ